MSFEIDLQNRNYIIKFSILISATIIGMMSIWWTLVREESSEWVSGQILHQPSQYAISKMYDGRFEIVSILRGFSLVSPKDWQAEDERNPIFYLTDEEKRVCEIKTEWINAKKTAQIKSTGILGEQINLSTVAGNIDGWRKEILNTADKRVFQVSIPVDIAILQLTLSCQLTTEEVCLSGLDELIASFQT
jgi:hypothetical protein